MNLTKSFILLNKRTRSYRTRLVKLTTIQKALASLNSTLAPFLTTHYNSPNNWTILSRGPFHFLSQTIHLFTSELMAGFINESIIHKHQCWKPHRAVQNTERIPKINKSPCTFFLFFIISSLLIPVYRNELIIYSFCSLYCSADFIKYLIKNSRLSSALHTIAS